MYNRTLKDWSAIDPDIKIKDVLKEMIDWVIEREVRKPPYIAWLSIGQLQWGNGCHFKDMQGSLGKGLNKHMGFRKGWPAGEQQRRKFFNINGWDPGAYPAHYPGILKTWINEEVIKKILAKKKYPHIVPLFGPGYYDYTNGQAEPVFTQARVIMGYFFALESEDDSIAQIQQEFIESRWKVAKQRHIVPQFEHCKPAMEKHARDQVQSAQEKIDYKERLREIAYFKKISARRVLPKSYCDEIDDRFRDDD